jgi:peroxygenase
MTMSSWMKLSGALVMAAAMSGCLYDERDQGDDAAAIAELEELVVRSEADRAVLALDAPERQPPLIPWDDMTALQRHVAFFDWNGDGYITVIEDYRGLRALGIDPVSATAFATAINGALATPTRGFPSLTIDLRAIASSIHGSDSGIYDSEGNFVPEAFERLFAEWDRNRSDGLDPAELTARAIVDSDLWDVFGTVASAAEFGLLFVVAAEDGELSRDRMRAFYDGTLFYVLAEARAGEPSWGWWW